MKKFNLKIFKTFILLLLVSIYTISCSKDESENITNQTEIEQSKTEKLNVENLNTQSNKTAINNLINNDLEKERLKDNYLSSIGIDPSNTTDEDYPILDINKQLQEYNDCSECSSEYKGFLSPMFLDLINTDDSELIVKLSTYKNNISEYSTDQTTRANLNFILDTFIASAEYNLTEQNNIASKSCGTSIGRGLVGGFITGCVNGAYVGATVGTVTVPIIGTVTGAVAGCIASGAVGSVWGAGFGALWGCIFD